MRRKLVLVMTLTLVFVGVCGVAFEAQRVKAQPYDVIFIRPNGDVEPSWAPVKREGNIYFLTGNVSYPEFKGISVQADNVILDGLNAYYLEGPGNSYTGIHVYDPLSILSSVTVRNMMIDGYHMGIRLDNCTYCTIHDNLLTKNDAGIELDYSNSSDIDDNTMRNNEVGIVLYASREHASTDNSITWNNGTNNGIGIELGGYASGNKVSWNTLEDNFYGIYFGNTDNIISENTLENNTNGIRIAGGSNNVVDENTLRNNDVGIYVERGSHNNNIFSNSITESTNSGIYIYYSSTGNTVYGNVIESSDNGISLEYRCSDNVISGNLVRGNDIGIRVEDSGDNMIYHNSFIGNILQACITITGVTNYENDWDNGYPSGGNYWSNYDGADYYSGYYQNETGSDGIGDESIVVNGTDGRLVGYEEDLYPLITSTVFEAYLTYRFGVMWDGEPYYVDVRSNSTVLEAEFKQSEKSITLNVAGLSGTTGFCNITIPNNLLEGDPWTVLVNGSPPTPEPTVTPNATHTFIYFTYSHSTETLEIKGTHVIPEFPSFMVMSLFIIAALLAVVIHKRRCTR